MLITEGVVDDAKPNRRKRSPNEDKRLSYEHDRRNTYGQSDKAARKAVPRFKTASNRAGRHGVNQTLKSAGAKFAETDEARLVERALKANRPQKRKSSATPLGRVVAFKKTKRIARVGGKAKRAAARVARNRT